MNFDNDWDYLGTFVILLEIYRREKKLLKDIEGLSFLDYFQCRAVLNKREVGTKEYELSCQEKKVKAIRDRVFDWLDKKGHNPYFFILNPVFKSGYSYLKSGVFSKIQIEHTGLINLDLACEYANYKITEKIIE